jgi:uncharacterized coiled-coil DUF342 family protein
MMVEGTVEVQGTVKVDKSSELDNLLVLAERAFKGNDVKGAENYYDNILRIDPNNWKANFYKAYCSEALSDNKSIYKEFPITKALFTSIDIICNKNPIDTDAITEIMSEFSDFAGLRLFMIECKWITDEYVSLVNSVPIFETLLYVDTCILHADYVTNQMVTTAEKTYQRLKEHINKANKERNQYIGNEGYYTEMKTIMVDFENLINEPKKKQNEAYWSEHAEEKQKLESERDSLQSELRQLQKQIETFDMKINSLRDKSGKYVASEKTKSQIIDDISKLRKQQSSLGIFKGKEMKALQVKINVLIGKLNEIDESIEKERKDLISSCNKEISEIEAESKPINDKINSVQNRINEINIELTKNR